MNPPSPDPLPPTYRDDEHFIERHATFLKLAQETPIRLLFLGDSITRRWVDHLHLWNQYFAPYQPANFGVGGDAAENVLWRIQNGELEHLQPQVIVLLIGTNNVPNHSGPLIAATIQQIIATIHTKLPETKILLMAIFPRGPQTPEKATPTNPYTMEVVRTANQILATFDNQDTLRFLDLGVSFLRSDGEIDTSLMPDQLHIIEPGYRIWGEAITDILQEKMDGTS